jgi:hypothetical protein
MELASLMMDMSPPGVVVGFGPELSLVHYAPGEREPPP